MFGKSCLPLTLSIHTHHESSDRIFFIQTSFFDAFTFELQISTFYEIKILFRAAIYFVENKKIDIWRNMKLFNLSKKCPEQILRK